MKYKFLTTGITFILASILFTFSSCINDKSDHDEDVDDQDQSETAMKQEKKLRHVVLFKFKEEADQESIIEVEEAFRALPSKIPEIKDLEWGINNSPEGLNKGFTHCFFLTFDSEEGRASYLPHPDHKAFGAVLSPLLEDVLVVDYWSVE